MIKYKNYAIEPNECGGYVLSEEKIYGETSKNKGEIYYSTICYPSTLKGCLTKILNLEFAKVVNENVLDLKQTIIELDKINNELTDFLNNNIKEEIK